MKVKVKFFAAFKELFGVEEKEVELNSKGSVRDLLNALCNSNECRQKLFKEDGEIRRDVGILRKGKHVQLLYELDAKLEDGDVISMFPPIFGG